MNGFIYIIRNKVNNKVYIGQTRTSLEQRWKEHIRHAQYGDQVINRAMKKYGVNNFYIEVLENCDIKDLDQKETYYIEKFNSTNKFSGYNVSIGGKTPKFKAKEIDTETLIDLYINQGYTLQKLAQLYNVTRYIITTNLKNAGIILRDRHVSANKVDKVDIEAIINAIENTKSLREAAKYINMKYSTFRKACIINNIEYNSSTSARHQKQ